jgi:hypothetical protein
MNQILIENACLYTPHIAGETGWLLTEGAHLCPGLRHSS